VPEANLDFDPTSQSPVGEFIAFTESPACALEASRSGWCWISRYRSPLDAALRQNNLGA